MLWGCWDSRKLHEFSFLLFLFFLLLGYPLVLLSTNFRVAGRSGSAGATRHDAKLFFPHASVSEAPAAWASVASGLVASALAASAWVALGHGLGARPRPVASGRGFGPWPWVLGLGALGLGLGSSAVVVTVNCSDLGLMSG